MNFNSRRRTLWLQVVALATVQGAIALVWVIYNLYLGKLLSQFGFPVQFVLTIVIIENILAMIMEPLMGSLSDQAQRWVGSRFPLIALGVILASALLIATPAVVVWGQPEGLYRWLLPVVLIAWAIAMTIFRSPALSLLGRYAFGSGLPQAAGVLTLMGALAGAAGPLANEFILSLGAPIAFGVGSLALLAATATLRAVNPNQSVQRDGPLGLPPQRRSLSLIALGLVFAVGMCIGLGFRLQMLAFPQVLAEIPGINVGGTMGTIFLALAVTALPAGSLASWMGNRRAMVLGLVGIALVLGLISQIPNGSIAILMAIALGACLSLVNNGTLPFALSMVPANRGGLGIGLFFSGGALATNLFAGIFKSGDFAPPTLIAFSVTGFLMAGMCITLSAALAPPSNAKF